MNGVVKTSLLLLLVFAIGDGHISSKTSLDISKCFDLFEFNGNGKGLCPNTYKMRLHCLNEIDPINDYAKMEVEEAIQYETDKQNACSNVEKKCVDDEAVNCMAVIITDKNFSKKDICDHAETATTCLMKLNNTCEGDVVKYETKSIELVKLQCASGFFKDGPCHPKAMLECTKGVLYNVYYPGDDIFAYSCAKSDVDRVKTCLANLNTKCTSQYQQAEIEDTLEAVDARCPIPN